MSTAADHDPLALARQLSQDGHLKLRWTSWLDTVPEPIPQDVDLADKLEGMLLGLAIGDALGNTTESMNPRDRHRQHGRIDDYLAEPVKPGLRRGLPSDDTQLAFWTLEHLIAEGQLHPQRLGEILSSRRIAGIGQATRQWVRTFQSGVPWHTSGTPSAGNGALMRTAPVLVPHVRTPSAALWADTLVAAHLTHDDELSNLSCVALVDLLWRCIASPAGGRIRCAERWIEICDELSTGQRYAARNGHPPGFVGTVSELLRTYLLPALLAPGSTAAACDAWHSGAYLLETVPSVLYILERHGDDPREALLQAVNDTRDNDTIAAIVGAVVGARHGRSGLPAHWVDGLLGRTRFDDDGRVFELMARSGEVFGYGVTPATAARAGSSGR